MNFPQFKFAQKSNNTGPRMGTYTRMPADCSSCSTSCHMTSFWFLPSFSFVLSATCSWILVLSVLVLSCLFSKRRSKRNFKPFWRQQIHFNWNITLWQIWHNRLFNKKHYTSISRIKFWIHNRLLESIRIPWIHKSELQNPQKRRERELFANYKL